MQVFEQFEIEEAQSNIRPIRRPYERRFRIKNCLVRECLAEGLGTFILDLLGIGTVAQTILSEGTAGSQLTIVLGSGLALMMGIYMSFGVSGGHINPAITLTFAVLWRRIAWKKVPFYILSQLIGSILGTSVVYGIYYSSIPENEKSIGIFTTHSKTAETIIGSFLNEFVGSAILLGGIFALVDSKNTPASRYTLPPAIGLLLIAIGFSFGWKTTYALNPARDLGPRIFASMAGWGSLPFTIDRYYFWVPLVAPCMGGIFGAAVYFFMVEFHHPIRSKSRRREMSYTSDGMAKL